jgi:hypothetical protein
MMYLERLFFPGEAPDQCRRKMRLLCAVIILGLLFAAVLAGGLLLLNSPIRR